MYSTKTEPSDSNTAGLDDLYNNNFELLTVNIVQQLTCQEMMRIFQEGQRESVLAAEHKQ